MNEEMKKLFEQLNPIERQHVLLTALRWLARDTKTDANGYVLDAIRNVVLPSRRAH